jgi:hypothetical protein
MAKATLAQSVSDWLGRVTAASTPPASVVAYNVGLLQTARGYSAYLVGADHYDERTGDWACRESFTPAERYLPLPRGGPAGWEQVQAAVVAAVREFLGSPAGRGSFLGRAVAVTVGFDDGELERVA